MTTCDTFVLFIANLARTSWDVYFFLHQNRSTRSDGEALQAGLSLEAPGVLAQQLHTVSVYEVLAGLFIEFVCGQGPGDDACISRVWAVADAV